MRRRIAFLVGTAVTAVAGYQWRALLWEVGTNVVANLGASALMVAAEHLLRSPATWLLVFLFLAVFAFVVRSARKPIGMLVMIGFLCLGAWWYIDSALDQPEPGIDSTPTVTPTIFATATMEPQPSVTPTFQYPSCLYAAPPCYEIVKEFDNGVRDSLTTISITVYGSDHPILVKAICDANRVEIEARFYANLTRDEREKIWGNDPCNYVEPGQILIVPIRPEISE